MSMSSPLVDDDHSQYQLSKAIKTNRYNLKRRNQEGSKMMSLIKSGLRFAAGGHRRNLLLLVLALASSTSLHVRCQDFEDLKNNNLQRQAPNFGAPAFQAQQFSSQPPQQQVFQPGRQQQFPGAATATGVVGGAQTEQAIPSVNSRSPFQRPVLSSRFSQQQQPQQSPQQPVSLASASTSSVVSGGQASSGAASQSASSIEAIMKSALARTAKLEGVESRQDSGNSPQAESASPARSPAQTVQASQTSTTLQRERQAEPSESTASTQPVEDAPDKQTTTQSSHETVYSDQRFANLFARRNAAKKSKLVPMEQPKAKPTLPSFIKSLPDPKQFTANPLEQSDRPISSSSSNLVSARLQQQQSQVNQNRVPKKSSSVASSSPTTLTNSNKRGQAQKAPNSAPSAKANASAKAGAGPPPAATKPTATANNPFSKSQANTSDPANVIAMARRRLLANNALQQKQQAN